MDFDYAQFSLPSLRQIRPDLVILDLEDTGVGWEVLQILKMDDITAKIPVVIATPAFYLSAEIRRYLLAQYIHPVSVTSRIINVPGQLMLPASTTLNKIERSTSESW